MPKEVSESEMEKIGIIADTLARLVPEGTLIEVAHRGYFVGTVRGPVGKERMILVIQPYLEVPEHAISASMLYTYRYYGHTEFYDTPLADPLEFKVFYQYLPEILRGFGVTKEELIRELEYRGYSGSKWRRLVA
jgi:hypothetical protein